MKKRLSFLASAILTGIGAFAQPSVSNGDFESFSSLPTCAPATCITKANSWHALSTTYGSSCSGYSDVADCSTGVDYYNGTTGGTGACQTGAPRNGTGYAHCQIRGFYPSNTALDEFVYQNVGSCVTTKTYRVIAYVTASGFTLSSASNGYNFGFYFVNTSNTTAAQILGNMRGQTFVAPIVTAVSGGWVKLEYAWTPPSNASYYLVIGAMLFCDDSNYSTTKDWYVDDVSIDNNCLANAGPNVTTAHFTCCTPHYTSAQIGTPAVTGYSYSWSPSTFLDNSAIAQPNSTPTVTTSYTVTVSGNTTTCTTSTSSVTVTMLTNSVECCGGGGGGRLANPGDSAGCFQVFPNPNKGLFTVTMPEGTGNIESVRVFDLQGRLVFEKLEIGAEKAEIDLSHSPAGTYLIKVVAGGVEKVNKVVIE